MAGVAACLAAGLVPVLHGDAVLDTHTGCTVLSGDVILSVLARALCPRRAVFLTNVCGVYDRPPEQAGARLVRAVAVEAGAGPVLKCSRHSGWWWQGRSMARQA